MFPGFNDDMAGTSLQSGSVSQAAHRLVVRACDEEDLLPLEWDGMFRHHRSIYREAYARQQRGEIIMLVGELAGRLVAQVWVDFCKLKQQNAALLWALRVHPGFQCRRLGTRMVLQAEAAIRRRELKVVELGLEKNNPRPRTFYERLGYECVGELCETYSYVLADGSCVTERSDQWRFRKAL